MPIAAVCPQCSTNYTLSDDKQGKTLRCRSCQATFTVAPPSPAASLRPNEKLANGDAKQGATATANEKAADKPEAAAGGMVRTKTLERLLRDEKAKKGRDNVPIGLMLVGGLLTLAVLGGFGYVIHWLFFSGGASVPLPLRGVARVDGKGLPTGEPDGGGKVADPKAKETPPPQSPLDDAVAKLKSNSIFDRRDAANALKSIPVNNARRAEVAQGLERVLGEARVPGDIETTARALAVWGVAETTVPALVARLEGNERFGRAVLIDALAGFRDPRAADVLARHLATNEWAQAGKALEDIGKVAAPAVAKQYFNPHGDGQKEARRLCMKWGVTDDTIVEQSVAALKSAQAGTRRSAVEWLATATPVESRQAAVSAALLPLLGDKDRNVPRPAATALSVWAGKDDVPGLIAGLSSRDDGVRHALIDALGRLKDERAATPLADRLGGNFGKDRAKASEALMAIGPAAEKAVLKKLDDRDAGTRIEACRILKKIGTADSIAPLEKAKGDKKVAAAADEAIQAIKERK